MKCLAVWCTFIGVSAALAEPYRPYEAWRDGWEPLRATGTEIGKNVSTKPPEAAGSWFMPLDEVAGLDTLLEDRRDHGTYSSSHRATLISWAAYFDANTPCDLPSSGHGLNQDDQLEEDHCLPGGLGPNIPPVPSPGSCGLAAIGCALFLFARQRVRTFGT
jgi:hypothetical protein